MNFKKVILRLKDDTTLEEIPMNETKKKFGATTDNQEFKSCSAGDINKINKTLTASPKIKINVKSMEKTSSKSNDIGIKDKKETSIKILNKNPSKDRETKKKRNAAIVTIKEEIKRDIERKPQVRLLNKWKTI